MPLNNTQLQTDIKNLSTELETAISQGTPKPKGYWEEQIATLITNHILTLTVQVTEITPGEFTVTLS